MRALRMLALCTAFVLAAAPPGDARAQVRHFSAADARLVGEAIAAANAGQTDAALALAGRARDRLAAKLITWYAFSRRDARAEFGAVVSFIRDNPRWPARDQLSQTAERSIAATTKADALLAWLADNTVESFAGLTEAIAVLKRQGQADEADALVRRAWSHIRLTADEENEVLSRYGKALRSEQHAERIANLAALDKQHARRLLSQVTLDPAHKLVTEARLMLRDNALRYHHSTVLTALAAVPAAERRDEGLLYDHMRWARRSGRAFEAHAIFEALPATLAAPERWWKEFEIVIRQALQARQFAAAYAMARQHRQRAGESLIEAEFLAGFIAFRLLSRGDLAERHFAAVEAEKPPAIEAARAAYWLGRIAEAKRDRRLAAKNFARAAAAATTFYGQLAAATLNAAELALDPADAVPAAAKRFADDELVRSAVLLKALGERRAARLFALRAMALGSWPASQHLAAAQLVLDLTPPRHRDQTAVRLAKLAARDGAALAAQGYPAIDLPEANTIEPALVFAVIRQESEFQANAKSHAGARGLMQLMPFTAKKEAAEIALPYALNRLTSDPGYNLRLGTVHLARLSDLYGGSYPLMVAAYNAGAERVDSWLAAFGDPRQAKIDWVDWMELIPIEETRLYTKFVLEELRGLSRPARRSARTAEARRAVARAAAGRRGVQGFGGAVRGGAFVVEPWCRGKETEAPRRRRRDCYAAQGARRQPPGNAGMPADQPSVIGNRCAKLGGR